MNPFRIVVVEGVSPNSFIQNEGVLLWSGMIGFMCPPQRSEFKVIASVRARSLFGGMQNANRTGRTLFVILMCDVVMVSIADLAIDKGSLYEPGDYNTAQSAVE
jgi:hypothetical protein